MTASEGAVGGPRAADAPQDAAALGRGQVRGSALLVGGRLASMVLTVATQVVVVRTLSTADYGAFAFALAITSACRTLLSLGQSKSLSRHLAVHDEQRDHGRLIGTALVTGLTVLLSSVVVVSCVLLLRDPIGATFLDSVDAVDVLVVLVLLAPVEALDEVFVAMFAVFARPVAIFFRRFLLTPALRLATVAAVALTGGTAEHVAIGYVATGLLGIALYAVLLWSLLRDRGVLQGLARKDVVLPFRDVFSFSLPLLSQELVYLSTHLGSVMLLAYFWTAADVADYRAVFPAARLNQFVYAGFALLFLPMAARLFARGDLEGLRSRYWHSAVLLAVLSFPVCAMTVPFAPATTVALFGERYADAAVLLTILGLGYYLNVCLGFNLLALQVVGRVRYLLAVNVAVAAGNLALSWLLVPAHGAVGVATANAVTLLAQNVLYQWALRGSLRTRFVDPSCRRAYAVVAGGLLVLAGLQLLLDPDLLLALPLAAAVWLAVLSLTRRQLELEQTFPELRRVPGLRRLLL